MGSTGPAEFSEIPREVYIPGKTIGIGWPSSAGSSPTSSPSSAWPEPRDHPDMDLILQRFCGAAGSRAAGESGGNGLAYKILCLWRNMIEMEEYVRVPDTWYLNSGFLRPGPEQPVPLSYLQIRPEEIQREFSMWRRSSSMPPLPRGDRRFPKILEEMGTSHLIRSSSLLEDSFSLAFSKYLSVF
jgi:hypothetical protein